MAVHAACKQYDCKVGLDQALALPMGQLLALLPEVSPAWLQAALHAGWAVMGSCGMQHIQVHVKLHDSHLTVAGNEGNAAALVRLHVKDYFTLCIHAAGRHLHLQAALAVAHTRETASRKKGEMWVAFDSQ